MKSENVCIAAARKNRRNIPPVRNIAEVAGAKWSYADYTLESVAGMFMAEIKWPNYVLRQTRVS